MAVRERLATLIGVLLQNTYWNGNLYRRPAEGLGSSRQKAFVGSLVVHDQAKSEMQWSKGWFHNLYIVVALNPQRGQCSSLMCPVRLTEF